MMRGTLPRGQPLEVDMAASISRITATLFLVLIAQQVLAQQPPANRPFEGTYWKATELGAKPTPAQNPEREADLLFKGGGVSGSNGVTGSPAATS